MSIKHTPGPWATGDTGRDGSVWVTMGSDSYRVAVACTGHPPEEVAANAVLIAAAPTTAQLAMEFTMLVEKHLRDDSGRDDVSLATLTTAMYELRAHVAAATGEEA